MNLVVRLGIVLVSLGGMAGGAVACGGDDKAAMARAVELSKTVTALGIEDVTVGTGAEAAPGRRVRVHYTGTLMEGTKFDSSRDRNEPYEFVLGRGEVIAGWDEGLRGMKVGGVRRLTVPARMAYGSQARGPLIPANAALKFEVELLGVE
jgi:FKBP-type peptidyl-prolyl cis-trans isomerase FkpA